MSNTTPDYVKQHSELWRTGLPEDAFDVDGVVSVAGAAECGSTFIDLFVDT